MAWHNPLHIFAGCTRMICQLVAPELRFRHASLIIYGANPDMLDMTCLIRRARRLRRADFVILRHPGLPRIAETPTDPGHIVPACLPRIRLSRLTVPEFIVIAPYPIPIIKAVSVIVRPTHIIRNRVSSVSVHAPTRNKRYKKQHKSTNTICPIHFFLLVVLRDCFANRVFLLTAFNLHIPSPLLISLTDIVVLQLWDFEFKSALFYLYESNYPSRNYQEKELYYIRLS